MSTKKEVGVTIGSGVEVSVGATVAMRGFSEVGVGVAVFVGREVASAGIVTVFKVNKSVIPPLNGR